MDATKCEVPGNSPRGMREALRDFAGFLFPERCALCGVYLWPDAQREGPVCDSCRAGLDAKERTGGCRVCSTLLCSEDEICMRCRAREFAFTDNYSAFYYCGLPKLLIMRYKLSNTKSLAPVLAQCIANLYHYLYAPRPLIPVPARRSSVRKRGWDSVGVVVDILSRRHAVPVLKLLHRGPGSAQKTLDYEQRLSNLTGVIRLSRAAMRAGAEGAGLPANVVLFDDIFTTGATAHECARILLAGGVRSVRVLTAAVDL